MPSAEATVPRRQEVTSGRQGFSEGSGRVAGMGLSQGADFLSEFLSGLFAIGRFLALSSLQMETDDLGRWTGAERESPGAIAA